MKQNFFLILVGIIISSINVKAALPESELSPVIKTLRQEFKLSHVPMENELRLDSNWNHCERFNSSSSATDIPIAYIKFTKFNGLIQFTLKTEDGWVGLAAPKFMSYDGTYDRHSELYGAFQLEMHSTGTKVPRKAVVRITRSGDLIVEDTYLPGYYNDDNKYPLAISFRNELSGMYTICPAGLQ